ncbi:hypothetical protein [Agrobacterium sp. Azo12]|nr:hypothetical protein [Agrobacterium sp. Azo12]MDO5898124.1 hypothetical protein [Agrobacterium sp. Azo12]
MPDPEFIQFISFDSQFTGGQGDGAVANIESEDNCGDCLAI